MLRQSRDFRNPTYLAKLSVEIDQYGTCFNPDRFDPKAIPPADFIEELEMESLRYFFFTIVAG